MINIPHPFLIFFPQRYTIPIPLKCQRWELYPVHFETKLVILIRYLIVWFHIRLCFRKHCQHLMITVKIIAVWLFAFTRHPSFTKTKNWPTIKRFKPTLKTKVNTFHNLNKSSRQVKHKQILPCLPISNSNKTDCK